MKDQWYPVAMLADLGPAPRNTILMETPVRVWRDADGTVRAEAEDGRDLPVTEAYHHLWISLGTPNRPIFDIPEARQPGRRFVPCGRVRVACSPLRAVENFLDIAHFPFVHTDILGSEPHTEVARYKAEVREEEDEVWATKVEFYQPQAAKSASGGTTTEYMYRVPAPTSSVLYKTCPPRPGEWDVIAIFVQPVTETTCDVWPWMALFDDVSPQADLVAFQQMIFVQDRSILENQVPALLPLDPGLEIPTRADMTSVAYRRWLKSHGYIYGAQLVAA
ncbi:aromatic ring-hydroxylating dioxygenase subunit alpha [Palleronia sp. LCG004]|uniref:aromatic ring-hydroxylating dioxygenase subunit alpha n=1 Tax=Palleronia sp. LCG004 TaxID=3079304 RepID=UPI002942380A|nr:aromatic ring-hydroxylating dioxygenase subunit alpha [Palleronia sp. LCG004]WOI56442.1 aromatic ring-hydroxylating dioxygenase subunit alpha [Palleronia sp. LCG004]